MTQPYTNAMRQLAYINYHIRNLPFNPEAAMRGAMISHRGALRAARTLRSDPSSHAMALDLAAFARRIANIHSRRITILGGHHD